MFKSSHSTQLIQNYSKAQHVRSRLKSKYPSYFPVRWVFRDPGIDVTVEASRTTIVGNADLSRGAVRTGSVLATFVYFSCDMC